MHLYGSPAQRLCAALPGEQDQHLAHLSQSGRDLATEGHSTLHHTIQVHVATLDPTQDPNKVDCLQETDTSQCQQQNAPRAAPA